MAGDLRDIGSLTPGLKKDSSRPVAMAALAGLAGITVLDAMSARAAAKSHDQKNRIHNRAARDYSGRSGFPRTPEEMRGAVPSGLTMGS